MGCGDRRAPDVVVPAANVQDYTNVLERVRACRVVPLLPIQPASSQFGFGNDIRLDGATRTIMGISLFNVFSATMIKFDRCRQAEDIAAEKSLPVVTTLGRAGFGRCVSVHSMAEIYRGPQLTLPVSAAAVDAGLLVGDGRASLIIVSPTRAEIHCFGGMSADDRALFQREPLYETARKRLQAYSPVTVGLSVAAACGVLVGTALLYRRRPSQAMRILRS